MIEWLSSCHTDCRRRTLLLIACLLFSALLIEWRPGPVPGYRLGTLDRPRPVSGLTSPSGSPMTTYGRNRVRGPVRPSGINRAGVVQDGTPHPSLGTRETDGVRIVAVAIVGP